LEGKNEQSARLDKLAPLQWPLPLGRQVDEVVAGVDDPVGKTATFPSKLRNYPASARDESLNALALGIAIREPQCSLVDTALLIRLRNSQHPPNESSVSSIGKRRRAAEYAVISLRHA